jgi:hypothetical protein
MTALDEHGVEMAENSDARTLDEMFQWLESAPEGFKVEIVEGAVFMSPKTPVGLSLSTADFPHE